MKINILHVLTIIFATVCFAGVAATSRPGPARLAAMPRHRQKRKARPRRSGKAPDLFDLWLEVVLPPRRRRRSKGMDRR